MMITSALLCWIFFAKKQVSAFQNRLIITFAGQQKRTLLTRLLVRFAEFNLLGSDCVCVTISSHQSFNRLTLFKFATPRSFPDLNNFGFG